MTNRLSENFITYISAQYPDALVGDFNFLASGFESDVYTFSLQLPGTAPQDYVLRLFNREDTDERIVREANGLNWLKGSGVSAPELLLYETNSQILGKPFEIIEKLDGQALWPVLATADPSEAAHHLSKFGELLSQLHQLDWRSFTA